MEREATYRIDLQQILDLPKGPHRTALARKAIAIRAGRDSSDFLWIEQGIQHDDDVMDLLESINLYEQQDVKAVRGSQPSDAADGTAHEADIECFFQDAFEADVVEARRLKKEIRRRIGLKEWHEAAILAVQGLFQLHGNRRRGMVKLLGAIAPHDVVARMYYGKALVRGENCARNVDRGLDILDAVSFDEDPMYAGYAHFVMGETLVMVQGAGYRALRHFENAAYLGWEDASEPAGVLCLIGSNGVAVDVPRALRNFKYGISKGQISCMTKYVVMVLRGEAPYDPAWRSIYDTALANHEALALRIQQDLSDADEDARGDRDIFLAECRERLDIPEARVVEFQPYVPRVEWSEAA